MVYKMQKTRILGKVSIIWLIILVSQALFGSTTRFSEQPGHHDQHDLVNQSEDTQIQEKHTPMPPTLPYHQLPVYGNASLGYYYVKIYMGSPKPQPQSVIIDTGSGLLSVPGNNCKKCSRHIDPPYNPNESHNSRYLNCSSSHPTCIKSCKNKLPSQQCPFTIFYAEGSSLEGVIVEDDIRFETYSQDEQIRTAFGYTKKQTNYFLTQKANGIFGLAPKRDSDLLEKMVRKHSPTSGEKLQFGLCLSSNGGVMTIGSSNSRLHNNKLSPDLVIAYNDHKNLYSLNGVVEISLGDALIHMPGAKFGNFGIFIDSGSTFTYLPTQRFNVLESKLNRTCGSSGICTAGSGEDSTCYKLKLQPDQNLHEKVEEIFPRMQFVIQNSRIYWSPKKYLLVRSEQNNEVCLGISPLDRYLLGANWMYDRDIIFDLENRTISIYDDMSCKDSPEQMARYLRDDLIDSSLSFTEIPGAHWSINIRSTMFTIGVICLILAISLFIILRAGCCDHTTKNSCIESDEVRIPCNSMVEGEILMNESQSTMREADGCD